MIPVKMIITPQNIIFDEELEPKFEWILYHNYNISIKLCRVETKKFIVIEEKKQPDGLEKGELFLRCRLLFERVMALLRMHKHGNIQADSFQIIIDDSPLETKGFPYMKSWGPILCSFYIINISDKDKLKEIFNYFEDLDIENTFLHWFTYAPFRPLVRDRLVDYVIALEGMFIEYIPSGGKRGLGKKDTLKSRGKDIFNSLDYENDNRPNVTDWDSFVDDFYNYRSLIVHGAKKEDQPPVEDIVKTVNDLEIICRGFLKRFLRDGVLYDWNIRKSRYGWQK